jgi:hypothetical protein
VASSKTFLVVAACGLLGGAGLSCSSDAGEPAGSGGATANGGATGAGATPAAGGVGGTGGTPSSSGSGGGAAPGTGGTASTGGGPGNGGNPGAGGAAPASGGTPASGGALPGSGGSAGAGGSSTPDGGGDTPRPDLGEGDGKDVITIGDSWMSLGFNGIQQSLLKASDRPYRTYGVAGTQLLNGQIPGQYASAKRADPDIKTVVMTGGGNDVLLTGLSQDCANGGERCTAQLIKIGEGLAALWKQMSADGVQDVVHVLYSSDAGSGVKTDAGAGIKKLCDSVPPPLRCHLLPTDDLVNGSLRADGIHPSNAAYDRIGKAVYDLMVAKGMRR